MYKEIENISQTYQRKVNECIESLQLAVELSFYKIDAQLDQILNVDSNPIIASQIQCDLSKVNQNCVFKLKDDNVSKVICQEVTCLIKNNIQHQFSKKEQQYPQELQQTNTQLQFISQQQDYQIQQLTNSQTIQQPSTLTSTQSNHKPFIYQLIPLYSINQTDVDAIAVNKDCSILIANCGKQIKVFDFKPGKLEQTSILSEHNNNVNTLNFMKKSDQFISGSKDKSIIIWNKNQNNSWICKQKMNGHSDDIICLVLNNDEDLIVSGSKDKTIKFWQMQNEWTCSQTITDHTSQVAGLSFNDQQNKLISCGYDQMILVIEKQQLNKQWIVIQKIKVEKSGQRLCFIDDYTFTFQPHYEQLNVFELDSTNNQYEKTKDILEKGSFDYPFFPQQYIKSKCILMNKNAQRVSLIQRKLNGEFITEQSFEFGTYALSGCMSDDGQYLITWDNSSKKFQIRKYQEK